MLKILRNFQISSSLEAELPFKKITLTQKGHQNPFSRKSPAVSDSHLCCCLGHRWVYEWPLADLREVLPVPSVNYFQHACLFSGFLHFMLIQRELHQLPFLVRRSWPELSMEVQPWEEYLLFWKWLWAFPSGLLHERLQQPWCQWGGGWRVLRSTRKVQGEHLPKQNRMRQWLLLPLL